MCLKYSRFFSNKLLKSINTFKQYSGLAQLYYLSPTTELSWQRHDFKKALHESGVALNPSELAHANYFV